MKKIKINLKRFQPKPEEEKSKLKPWQEEALKIIEEFQINGIFKSIIFKHAKKNMQYLQGKVTYARDRFPGEEMNTKGRYLISLFKKNKPWE